MKALFFAMMMFFSTAVHAAPQFTCKGKVSGPDGTIRGTITISTKALHVEHTGLFTREEMAYDFKNLKSVRVKKGLLFTRVAIRDGQEDSYLRMRTWAWHYDAVREVLRDKL